MNIKELIEVTKRINTVYIGDGLFDKLACEHRMPASADEIIEIWKTADFKESIYPIGYILEDYIVIKSDEIESGSYIYVGDAYCRDEYYSLDCDFKTFLDRFIMSGGNNFWRWQNLSQKYDFHND